jgi:molecular chaperone DnaK
MKDFGEKVPADLKEQIESAVKSLRDAMAKDDVQSIKAESDKVGELIQKIGAGMYGQPGQGAPGAPGGNPFGNAGGGEPDGGPQGGGQSGGNKGGEDVVEGEFRNA